MEEREEILCCPLSAPLTAALEDHVLPSVPTHLQLLLPVV